MTTVYRPTSLAAAFVNAAVRTDADPHKGIGNWVARRTLLNTERPGFGVIPLARESGFKRVDHTFGGNHTRAQVSDEHKAQVRPQQAAVNAVKLDSKTESIIHEAIGEVVEKLVTGRKVELMDEEILGID